MIKVLLLDNHDSFTYNLAAQVKRCKNVSLEIQTAESTKIDKINSFDKIIFSPGPGLPSEHGLMSLILDNYKNNKSILGVCLGHQAIGEYFGGKLENLEDVQHGWINHLHLTGVNSSLFNSIPDKSEIGVYHSWYVSQEDLPSCLKVTGLGDHHKIMSMEHDTFDIKSVQFHPESFITRYGEVIMNNWLK
jgi:anthranilate synthase/aminodeoxychorismate synthase-like glutamine amidotransferase